MAVFCLHMGRCDPSSGRGSLATAAPVSSAAVPSAVGALAAGFILSRFASNILVRFGYSSLTRLVRHLRSAFEVTDALGFASWFEPMRASLPWLKIGAASFR